MHPLKQGSTIAVITPASAISPRELTPFLNKWQEKGFRIKIGEHVYEKERFLGGTDEHRAADIHAVFSDKSVDVVFAARGGYGSARVLSLLDFDLIRKNKKIFVGISDTTALQNAFLAKADMPSLSGDALLRFHADTEDFSYLEDSLTKALSFQDQSFSGLLPLNNIAQEKINGRLAGGCLSLFSGLIGTPYLPDMTDKVLILEDVGEDPYRLDRMLVHLEQGGIFEQVKAVVFGEFYKCIAKDPTDGTVEAVLNEWGSRIKNRPVYKGLPYGHQPKRCVLPLGGKVTLENYTLFVQGSI